VYSGDWRQKTVSDDRFKPLRIQQSENNTKIQFEFNDRIHIMPNVGPTPLLVGMILELEDRIKAMESAINTLDERTKK
jgi:hypothetical protein